MLEVRKRLDEAVRSHLVSDVPVGVFLSGGIDSSSIAALAVRRYGGKLKSFSVGFDYEKGVNELPKARRLAEHLGTDHAELHVSAGDLEFLRANKYLFFRFRVRWYCLLLMCRNLCISLTPAFPSFVWMLAMTLITLVTCAFIQVYVRARRLEHGVPIYFD